MLLFGRHWTIAHIAVGGVVAILAGFALSLAAVAYDGRDFQKPAVYVLGAGDHLSLLVTDGSSRLFVANGSDSAALGNALQSVQPVGRDRIDIALLIGNQSDLTFLSRARSATNARHVEVIGDDAVARALGLPPKAPPESRRFWLSTDTSVTVDVLSNDSRPGGALLWRVIVTHKQVRVALFSSNAAIEAFHPAGVITMVMVGGENALDGVEQIQPLAVVVSGTVPGDDLRGMARTSLAQPVWTYRVFGGEVLRVGLKGDSLVMPPNGVQVQGKGVPESVAIITR